MIALIIAALGGALAVSAGAGALGLGLTKLGQAFEDWRKGRK